MPYYFMRDTPLQALEQLMMSQPGQKPRGGGIYRSPFHYTPKDVACEYCQNYVRKHPCRLCECTCLDERIEAGVLNLNEFVRDCFAPSMGPQFRKRMHQQLRERNPQFFLSNAHRRRWTYWRERCWRLSDRNKAALFLLTAYESLWRRMVWKCGNDGFDFQSVRLGGIEPELYSVYQAAKAIAVGCCNITDAEAFLECVREELPYRPTTGFRYEVLTDDPSVRKQVDDMIFDFYGEEAPCRQEEHEPRPEQGMTFGGM